MTNGEINRFYQNLSSLKEITLHLFPQYGSKTIYLYNKIPPYNMTKKDFDYYTSRYFLKNKVNRIDAIKVIKRNNEYIYSEYSK